MPTPQNGQTQHTQTIRRILPKNCLSVFEHFVGLAPKGLIYKALPKKNSCSFIKEL